MKSLNQYLKFLFENYRVLIVEIMDNKTYAETQMDLYGGFMWKKCRHYFPDLPLQAFLSEFYKIVAEQYNHRYIPCRYKMPDYVGYHWDTSPFSFMYIEK